MQARRRRPFLLFFLPLLLLSAGCRGNRTDLVESQLRTREQMYREALEEQQKSEFRIHVLQQEVDALRKASPISPELAAQTFGLKRIVLGRATGGYDSDALPGDELLQVIVEPRDSDDHTIKSPGTLYVFAFEINPQGLKFPIGAWEVAPETMRQNWKQSLLGTGYTIRLNWKTYPQYDSVRVLARLVTPDQRVYEADRDVKVRVVPGAVLHRSDPPLDTLPAPRLLPETEIGPMSHTTQWRATTPKAAVSIGRPAPLDK